MTRFQRSTPLIIAAALILACQSHAKPARPTMQTTLTVSANQPVGSDFDRTQYRPSSMEGLIANVNSIWNPELLKQDPNNSIYLEIDSEFTFPSRVVMSYLGEFREIPAIRMNAISAWLRGPRPSMSDNEVQTIFRYEGRFSEGTELYWLPVQTPLILSMQKELKPGDVLVLYMRWIALAKVDDIFDYVFLVNAWHGPF